MTIASTAGFTLDIMDRLNNEFSEILSTIRLAGGTISGIEAPTYYIEEPDVYRIIKHSFDSNFVLSLSVPNCTIKQARLAVSGTDPSQELDYRPDPNGQHYYIDDKEVSGCDVYFRAGYGTYTRGLSCGTCNVDRYYGERSWVTVIPVDITANIPYGLHEIKATDISDEHIMTIEAIKSISDRPLVLYNADRTIWVEDEVLSRPLDNLYSLIT